jgi:uncharacterized protein DUF4304
MAKSANVERLDTVQAFVTGLLKPLGFRRRGRTYNRTREPGVVQVVNLQSDKYPIGDQPDFPPMRVNHYGDFTVNLGVHIAEVFEATYDRPAPPFVQDYDCAMRARLGVFLDPPRDRWWPLSAPEAAAEEVVDLLARFGEPLLARFDTRRAIIEEWLTTSTFRSSRERLDIAIMLARRGETSAGLDLIDEHLRQRGGREDSHARYVRELAKRMAAGEFL